MAKMENGFLGGFSGRLGTAVGYQWRGKWCLRALQTMVYNPRTERQQEHRMMFKEEVVLAGRMNWALRETLAKVSLNDNMTPCNYFVKHNQQAFGWSDGQLTVDWEQLMLSTGPVAPVAFGALVISEGTTLTISFEKNPLHMRASANDRVYLYAYCPEVGEGVMTNPVYRYERRLSVVLPRLFAGREVQLWGMVQDRDGRWSETIYIGHGPIEDTQYEEDIVIDIPTPEGLGEGQGTETYPTETKGNKKSPSRGASGWSVGDSNSRPLPCEGSALNQLS